MTHTGHTVQSVAMRRVTHPAQIRLRTTLGVAVAAALVGAGAFPAQAAPSADVEPIAAIAAIAPEVLENRSDSTPESSDDGAIDTVENGTNLVIPSDAADGITLGTPDGTIGIGLPNADNAEPAVAEMAGVVSYDNGDGSTTVPVVKDDGSVQITTVIADATAPKRYEYPLDLPSGASLILDDSTGAVAVIDAAGSWLAGVAPAWAKDAAGQEVPTRYLVEGEKLVQLVDHSAAGFTYPIIADPWMGNALIKSFRWETSSRILVTPTDYSRGWAGNIWYQAVGNAGYDELISKQSSATRSRLNNSGRNQFVCHVYYAPFKSTWNLEVNKADKGLSGFILNACN